MAGQLVLSLFPGIGLLDMAFEEAGFCVVRGPDLLWGGDIRRFHPPAGRFDGVIGGPPCQAFSRLRHIVEANGYQTAPNLIPEFERCLAEAQPAWALMENVPDAPEPAVPGYQVSSTMLRDVWCGGETSRLRRFSFVTRDGQRLSWRSWPLAAAARSRSRSAAPAPAPASEPHPPRSRIAAITQPQAWPKPCACRACQRTSSTMPRSPWSAR